MERLLDQVLRGLRYRELRTAIGRSVTVHGSESIAPDVLRDLGADLPPDLSVYGPPFELYIPAQVAKYGLMDLVFRAGRPLSDDPADAAGLTRLGELDFLPSRFHLEQVPGEADPRGLSCLVEAMAEGLNFVRLFLTARVEAEGRTPAASPAPFPRQFVVEDACLTNAYPVWLHKHFYL